MRYEGTTYRPPVEMDTHLLQVTVGCAHNNCRFCAMYRNVDFRPSPLHEVEEDIRELRRDFRHVPRLFLVNGDAFVLGRARLEPILELIRTHLPECESVSMYSSVANIAAKSDDDLLALRELGIHDLYVGIESGYEPAVTYIRKGHTVDDARTQLQRLTKAGIRHAISMMLGVAGSGHALQNARATAELLNEVQPYGIWVGTLAVYKGTELADDVREGRFTLATEREILQEERELITRLHVDGAHFYGVHPTNRIKVRGDLPSAKPRMLATIDDALANTPAHKLDLPARRKAM